MSSRGPSTLFVVAHPDDEILFFLGTIQRLLFAGKHVVVACATGTFRTPAESALRVREFQASCEAIGVEGRLLGLTDKGEHPLDPGILRASIERLASEFEPETVYTHSPWGDYGHVHHMDVSLATHKVWGARVLSLAGPLQGTNLVFESTEANRMLKGWYMRSIYQSQAATWSWGSSVEHFAKLSIPVAHCLHALAVMKNSEIDGSLKNESAMEILKSIAHGFSSSSGRLPSEIEYVPSEVWGRRLWRFWSNIAPLAMAEDLVFSANHASWQDPATR